ncbi:MAG TPA: hypothetical protein VL595_04305 [Pseudonocardia sp.]|nr:hypothetical protein [Pseudonocardia sp.]
MRELDPDRAVQLGVCAFDLVERLLVRDAAEAEARDLVERRVGLGVARDPALEGNSEADGVGPPGPGGVAGRGDELSLHPLDALGQGEVAEQWPMISVHGELASSLRVPAAILIHTVLHLVTDVLLLLGLAGIWWRRRRPARWWVHSASSRRC